LSFNEYLPILPEIVLTVSAIVVLLTELARPGAARLLQTIALIGFAGALATALVVATGGPLIPAGFLNGMIATDAFGALMKALLCGVGLLAALVSRDYFVPRFDASASDDHSEEGSAGTLGSTLRTGEYYALMLLTTVGMTTLAAATDLVTLFIGVETMSVGLYCLAGIRSERPRSGEAALKYLLLGAFASGFLLYGMALIYGASGGYTNFSRIGEAVGTGGLPGMIATHPAGPVLLAGVALLLVGLLFKIAAAPFHFWSPDVYQGAPTPVSAFMSAGPKAAALAVFLRLFGWVFPGAVEVWGPAIWVVAALTMTVGNVAALAQTDLKRMLAYSSIAHAGYLLVAILAASHEPSRSQAAGGLFFYLTAYYLMNIGAFTVAYLVNRSREGSDYRIDDYKGLALERPWLAGVLTIFLVSLAGIPPTAGFFGKFYIFSAAVKAGYVGLVVIAVLNSVVSVYYYLRLVVYMYMRPREHPAPVRLGLATGVALAVCAVGILLWGVLPGMLMGMANAGAGGIYLPMNGR